MYRFFQFFGAAVFAFLVWKAASMSEQQAPKLPRGRYASEIGLLRKAYFGELNPKFPAGADTLHRAERIQQFRKGMEDCESAVNELHALFGEDPLDLHEWVAQKDPSSQPSLDDRFENPEMESLLAWSSRLRVRYNTMSRDDRVRFREALSRMTSGMQQAAARLREQERRGPAVASEEEELEEDCMDQIRSGLGDLERRGYHVDIRRLAVAGAAEEIDGLLLNLLKKVQIAENKPKAVALLTSEYPRIFLEKMSAEKVGELENGSKDADALYGIVSKIIQNQLELNRLKKIREKDKKR